MGYNASDLSKNGLKPTFSRTSSRTRPLLMCQFAEMPKSVEKPYFMRFLECLSRNEKYGKMAKK